MNKTQPVVTPPVVNLERYEEFKVKISQLVPFDLNFGNMTLTEYELLVMTIYRLNELIGIVNMYSTTIDEVLEWLLSDGLSEAVVNQLNVWLGDGTLEELINETLFNTKLDKITFQEFKNGYDEFLTSQENVNLSVTQYLAGLSTQLSGVDTSQKKDAHLLLKSHPLSASNVKLRIIGDSIARGSGSTNYSGLMLPIKEMYEGIDVVSYGVSSSSLSEGTGRGKITDQIVDVENDTTHCVIVGGVNDVSSCVGDRNWYIGYPTDPYLNYNLSDPMTSIGGLEKIFHGLRLKNPLMQLYYLVVGTSNVSQDFIKDGAFDYLAMTARKWGVNVVDIRKIAPKKWSPYYSVWNADSVHPNDYGYKKYAEYLVAHINGNFDDSVDTYPNIMFGNLELNNGTEYTNQLNDAKKVIELVGKYKKYVDSNIVTVVDMSALADNWVVEFGSVTTFLRGVCYRKRGGFTKNKIYNFLATFADNQSKDVLHVSVNQQNVTVPLIAEQNTGFTSLRDFAVEGTYPMRKNDLLAITDMPQEIKDVSGDIVEVVVLSFTGSNNKFLVSVGLTMFIVLQTPSAVAHKKII